MGEVAGDKVMNVRSGDHANETLRKGQRKHGERGSVAHGKEHGPRV